MPKRLVKGKKLSTVDLELERGVLHQLSAGVRQQRGPGTGLDQGGVQEDRRQVPVPPRSTRENDWYPHYIHNLDNLIRFGGLFPPIHVTADIRRTRLLGVTHAPREGGVMMVRARDDIYRMADLKGKKIGLSKSQNTIKNDWWGIQEEQGIELMLRMNGMTRKDVQIVEFPYPDDWYDKPEMMGPLMENPSELWLQRDHKHDLAFRPLETALEKGVIDAMYMQSKVVAACSQRRPASSSRSRTCPGTRTGACRWPTSRPPSPAPT